MKETVISKEFYKLLSGHASEFAQEDAQEAAREFAHELHTKPIGKLITRRDDETHA